MRIPHGPLFRLSTKAMFTIVAAIAEFERSIISEQVKAGIAKAMTMGRPHGRPGLKADVVGRIKKLRSDKLSIREIAKTVGVSKSAVQNYV